MTIHTYRIDEQLAKERDLRQRLERDWIEYQNSPPEQRPDARDRFLATLRSLSRLVNPR
jgi:hypothetical protein